jgi:glucokinase
MSVYVGFDIGGTKCAVSTGREQGGEIEILTRGEAPTPATQEEAMTLMCQMARRQAAGEEILGVGLSAGNPMDASRGCLLNPPNLPGWSGVSLTEWTERELGAPARLENDANACALAEWRWGAGRGARNMVFLTFGTGFGGGLILDGKLYRGATGNAGEVGHWRLAPFGPSGYGKLGSFESFCSGGGIRQLALTVGERYRQNGKPCAYLDFSEISARTVAQAARAGDEAAREVFDLSARMLGEGLSLIVDLINPDAIVIGSIYERCEDLIEPGMRRALNREALPDSAAACRILPAALGDSIGDYAALAIAVYARRAQ